MPTTHFETYDAERLGLGMGGPMAQGRPDVRPIGMTYMEYTAKDVQQWGKELLQIPLCGTCIWDPITLACKGCGVLERAYHAYGKKGKEYIMTDLEKLVRTIARLKQIDDFRVQQMAGDAERFLAAHVTQYQREIAEALAAGPAEEIAPYSHLVPVADYMAFISPGCPIPTADQLSGLAATGSLPQPVAPANP